MTLGVERSAVGDIVAGGPPEYFICRSELARFFPEQISRIGRAGVTLSEAPLSEIPIREESLRSKTITVSSPRLDTLVSGAFGLSREKAASMIGSGLASVNHLSCEKPDKHVVEGDLLSLRGHGRAKVLSVGGQSRKGRVFVELGIYE
jgi:RNA-binding protein YlmH